MASKQEETQILRLQQNDLERFVDLIKLFDKVFDMESFSWPQESHLRELLNKDDFEVWVALKSNTVVGGLTTYLFKQYYSEKPIAYIYDLAVAEDHRRKGIGKNLIETVKKCYAMSGFEDIFVQAETVDKNALEFYRSTNPSREEKMIYFSYSL